MAEVTKPPFLDETGRRIATALEGMKESASRLATVDAAGLVKPDGTSIKVDSDGTISVEKVDVATTETAGTVKPDGTTISVGADGAISIILDEVSSATIASIINGTYKEV